MAGYWEKWSVVEIARTMTEYLRTDQGGLVWGPLVGGTLIRRYNRFLADVLLANHRQVTAHCPNTGRMTGCAEPGWPVFLSKHNKPSRRLQYSWEMTQSPTSLVGVNTQVPNRLIGTAVEYGKIGELTGYDSVRREVAVGNQTRLDLMLESRKQPPCYIEIKNCTLVENSIAYFPDAVTERGQKHLEALSLLFNQGFRAVVFFLIQRMDAKAFRPADTIDPDYGRILRRVAGEGVELLAYDVDVNLERVDLHRRVEIEL